MLSDNQRGRFPGASLLLYRPIQKKFNKVLKFSRQYADTQFLFIRSKAWGDGHVFMRFFGLLVYYKRKEGRPRKASIDAPGALPHIICRELNGGRFFSIMRPKIILSSDWKEELTGGELVRSVGGWQKFHALRKMNIPFHNDERMLGDSDFVERVLGDAEDVLEGRGQYRS